MKYLSYITFILLSFLLLSCSKHTKPVRTEPVKDSSVLLVTDTITPENDYYKKEYSRSENHIYKDNVKTALLHKDGWQLSFPVIELNSNEKVKLSFDDLDADTKNYYYTIIHCSADWEPSDIPETSYIEGFAENRLTDYKFSFNTMQSYTHYNLNIPNEDLNIKISGNYLLQVFIEGNKNDLALTMRFMVVERKVTIRTKVKQASRIDDRNYKQEIDFTIVHEGYDIANPYGDIKVVITQNDRWDNAINDLKPLFVRNNELIYDHDEDNVFSAGNEYRHFDIKSLRYQSDRIKKITYEPLPADLEMSPVKKNHVYLFDEERRSFKRYSTEKDINGKLFIKTDEGTDSETEADYAYVHFNLPYEAPFIDGNLYVFGALSQWNFSKETQLKYNYKKFAYETAIYLKQGYYNYEYVLIKDGKTPDKSDEYSDKYSGKVADNTFIEGSHYETENDYTIYVYHNSFGGNYDRLIAVEKFNSR